MSRSAPVIRQTQGFDFFGGFSGLVNTLEDYGKVVLTADKIAFLKMSGILNLNSGVSREIRTSEKQPRG